MLWNEVELLQQEVTSRVKIGMEKMRQWPLTSARQNLRLRSVLKGHKMRLDERLSLKAGQADMKPETLTVGKYKRGYLKKKVESEEDILGGFRI